MKQKAFHLVFTDTVSNEVVFERFPADANMAHAALSLIGSDLNVCISIEDYEPQVTEK